MCLFKLPTMRNPFLQTEQTCLFLSTESSWVNMWPCKFVYLPPHTEHCGSWPLWPSSCILWKYFDRNILSQKLHLYRFWPVWISMCFLRLTVFSLRPHTLHWCLLSASALLNISCILKGVFSLIPVLDKPWLVPGPVRWQLFTTMACVFGSTL